MNPSPPPYPHAAAHFGLAAVALAGILLVMAAPALQLAFWLQQTNYAGFSEGEKQLAAYGGYLAAAVAVVLGLTAVVTGARGLGAAGRTGEPGVLCDTGIFLGLFAAGVWVACGVAWHSQAWRFIKPA